MYLDEARESFGFAVCVVWLISVLVVIGFGYVAFSAALESRPERALLSHSLSPHHPNVRLIKEVHAQKGAAGKAAQGVKKEAAKKPAKAFESRKPKTHLTPPRRPAKGRPAEG
jgi:hypothetical protein